MYGVFGTPYKKESPAFYKKTEHNVFIVYLAVCTYLLRVQVARSQGLSTSMFTEKVSVTNPYASTSFSITTLPL